MTSIQQRLSTGRGKFTTDHPELGTAPVDYEHSISPEFFADEREAVFSETGCASVESNDCHAGAHISPATCPAGWPRS
ncbi:hypothetical protein [Mycobacterium sp.]|uniref:hypothetical protein n=1 Tax=Mycobacterium sp. TaxID=1785 RepID=UPI003D0E3708